MKSITVVAGIIILMLTGLSYYLYDDNRQAQNEIGRLQGAHDNLMDEMKQEIDQGQVKITQLSDRLSVSIVDQILFRSGEAEISSAGMKVITRVGGILKKTPNKYIRVAGHTDNVRIAPRLQKKHATNWELSTARATNVVRLLQEKVGIKGNRLRAVGMSEYYPVASNNTTAGRRQNRRIEIALLAN